MITIIVVAVALIAVTYIMFHGIGLQDSLDFGAGAYYYADIPDFEKYTGSTHFQARWPFWAYAGLFLAWGALMYALWKYIDKH